MMRFAPLLGLAVFAAGCSGGGDSGDVETAKRASAAVPKSVDQLPPNLSPEKRSEAAGAMASQQAIAEQMNSQAAAMKAAQERAR